LHRIGENLWRQTAPYISGTGAISTTISLLRKNFPSKVTADTLKKLGIAPNNETYVLNILRFIGLLIMTETKRNCHATFSKHDDAEFQKAFEKVVKDAYSELFTLRGTILGRWTITR